MSGGLARAGAGQVQDSLCYLIRVAFLRAAGFLTLMRVWFAVFNVSVHLE
jgi:hypothetical protein